MLLALSILLLSLNLQPSDCPTWAECREQAQEARAAGDYERFHDLAWRAVQKGKANDSELMLLLARAQSLSGRPHDALVMLRRLAALGIRAEAAATDADFRRVRALSDWSDLEQSWAAIPGEAVAPTPAAEPRPEKVEPPKPVEPAKAVKPAAVPPGPPPDAPLGKPGPPLRGTETLRFQAGVFSPSGLTYDAVSRRFIIGDRAGRRLSVVDEFSHAITTLASARGAGFGEVTGIALEARDGTLWVVSNREEGSRLHKLQLISARELAHFDPPAPLEGSAFTDVVLDPRGGVLVLDSGGKRVLRLAPGGTGLRVLAAIDTERTASVAPASGGHAYVAHAGGLVRVNLASGESVDVTAPQELAVAGFTRIRWHEGALLGIQGGRAVRLRLTRTGRAVAAVEVLDEGIEGATAGALTVVGDTLYYLAVQDGATVIREVALGSK
jgi:hypothetical protein